MTQEAWYQTGLAVVRGIADGLVPLAEKADASGYKSSLAAPVRGLWAGVITLEDFFWAFGSAIDRGLTQAWLAGAAKCGIGPDELSDEERGELQRHILFNRMSMGGLAEQIVAFKKKDEGGPLAPHLARLDLWANRWNEVYSQAMTMACADQKLIWLLGPTKKHCASCAGFNNRVYRASVWAKHGAHTQARSLHCGGWNCLCRLEPTDLPVNRGRFPTSLLAV